MSSSVSFLREFEPANTDGRATTKNASRRAFEAGVEEGRAQAKSEFDQGNRAALDSINGALTALATSHDQMRAAVEAEAGRAVAAVVRSLCPLLAERGLADSVQALVHESLSELPRPVLIDVAPESFDALSDALQGDIGSRIELRLNASLLPASVKISAEEGVISVDVEGMVNRIMDDVALLERPIHHPTKEVSP
jgi:flagellar biosynthesis/type III secretory pathway protein FliH